MAQADEIEIVGARSNNLKSLNVNIPHKKLVVVTGVSGSGKSSLVMDTLYAEGQRRYVESLSAYARQFLNRMKKPELDYIRGLRPAIAIEQRVSNTNARSTVGSLTEIYDFVRLLFAKVGRTYSPISGREVKKNSPTDITDYILNQPAGSKCYVCFPIQQKYADRSFKQELEYLSQKGFTRLYRHQRLSELQDILDSNGHELSLRVCEEPIKSCLIVVDRFIVNDCDDDFRKRVADSVLTAVSESGGDCVVVMDEKTNQLFSSRFELDGIQFHEPSVELFNYNNSFGACPTCEGYGRIIGIDETKVIPNFSKSVYEGAIHCWQGEKETTWLEPLLTMAHKINFPLHCPYQDLSDAQKEILWYGMGDYRGIYAYFEELESQTYKIQNRILLSRFRGRTTCTACKGSRLRKEALYVKVDGKTFRDLMFIPVEELLHFFEHIRLTKYEKEIAQRLISEIKNRLAVLQKVGLSYLTLDRLSNTLSGGESQRIHLTRTLGSNLSSSIYILDEPSIGLHPKDTAMLVEALLHLRDLGNTVVVIEHEEELISRADHIIDIGPGAGRHGGTLVYSGPYRRFLQLGEKNLTASYLTRAREIPVPKHRKRATDYIYLKQANLHNLKNVNVQFPLQSLICLSGVSGSGKTSLVKHILYPLLMRAVDPDASAIADGLGRLEGAFHKINGVELVNQQSIGRSSRSNPATYVKAYDDIRDILKSQPLAKMRNYQAKHFSFNVEGGRCEFCKGEGEITVEMQFLADVKLVCEDCNGKRFTNEILEVRYKDKNIHDILCMSVEEAVSFFSDKKEIVKKLTPLMDVGLGYLQLGQSSSTLSGGEAQRLKLAYYLSMQDDNQRIFFIFDEPTTGLHFEDVRKLLVSLHALVEKGHTVLVIEHNMDVLKTADWIIDLGPGGGKHGGQVLFQGTPEQLVAVPASFTGAFLKKKLNLHCS